MIKIVPFELNHICRLGELMPVYKNDPFAIGRVLEKIRQDRTYSWTFIYKTKVVAILVGTQLWEHALDVCGLISVDVNNVKKSFYKACINLLRSVTETMSILRFQVIVKADYQAGVSTVEHLGFKKRV